MVFGPDARRIILAMLGKLPPRLRRVLVPFVSRYLRRRAMFFLSILSRRFGIVFVLYTLSNLRNPLGSFVYCDNIIPRALETTTMNSPLLVPTLFIIYKDDAETTT